MTAQVVNTSDMFFGNLLPLWNFVYDGGDVTGLVRKEISLITLLPAALNPKPLAPETNFSMAVAFHLPRGACEAASGSILLAV